MQFHGIFLTAEKFTDRRQKGDRNDAKTFNNGITLTLGMSLKPVCGSHTDKKTCENMPSSPPDMARFFWAENCRIFPEKK